MKKNIQFFDKLVRDRIPEIIESKGETVECRVLDKAEYRKALAEKLLEEGAELKANPSIEEVADVLEVLDAICVEYGFKVEDVLKHKLDKQEKRGGFWKKLFLIRTWKEGK